MQRDKKKAFSEAFRVLRHGGRLKVSDMVLLRALFRMPQRGPSKPKMSIEAYTGYISGAAGKEDYLSFIRAAGFQEVSVSGKTVFPLSPELQDMASRDGSVEMDGKALVASIGKSAKKPGSSIGSHF